jgi:hypothetical protein
VTPLREPPGRPGGRPGTSSAAAAGPASAAPGPVCDHATIAVWLRACSQAHGITEHCFGFTFKFAITGGHSNLNLRGSRWSAGLRLHVRYPPESAYRDCCLTASESAPSFQCCTQASMRPEPPGPSRRRLRRRRERYMKGLPSPPGPAAARRVARSDSVLSIAVPIACSRCQNANLQRLPRPGSRRSEPAARSLEAAAGPETPARRHAGRPDIKDMMNQIYKAQYCPRTPQNPSPFT